MEEKSMNELVVELKNDFNAEIFRYLVRSFIPLYKKNLISAPWFDFDLDDYYQEGQIIMQEAIEKFDPHKNGTFSTYFITMYSNHISNIHRKGRTKKRGGGIQELPLQYKVFQSQEEIDLLEVIEDDFQLTTPQLFELREAARKFFKMLSGLEMEVLLSSLAGISRVELGRRLKIKDSQIQSAYDRARDKLKRLLDLK